MSPIEKLKAEAVALRESEKAAGREMKHCDALEAIAKKHGYAGWRACIALLDKDGPTGEGPAVTASAGGKGPGPEIQPSRLEGGRLHRDTANGLHALAGARAQAGGGRLLAQYRAAADLLRNFGPRHPLYFLEYAGRGPL